MKHCKMYYAGYQHLSCDTKTHIHKLKNIDTGQIEMWKTCRCQTGIPYKNSNLVFLRMEWGEHYEHCH